jgi:hypothetical protein
MMVALKSFGDELEVRVCFFLYEGVAAPIGLLEKFNHIWAHSLNAIDDHDHCDVIAAGP